MCRVPEINYFDALEKLRPEIEPIKDAVKSVFKIVMNHGLFCRDIHCDASQTIDQKYTALFNPRTDTRNTKEPFSRYIGIVEEAVPVPVFITFLRYLGIYVVGKITHDMFARLVVSLLSDQFEKHPDVHKFLPQFLASVNNAACFQVSQRLDNEAEELALEVILKLTPSLKDPELVGSVAKCLNCLGLGVLSKKLGRKWMMELVKSTEVDAMLDKMSDFSSFLPGRIPQELVLCPDFPVDGDRLTMAQMFVKRELGRKSQHNLQPVMKEVIWMKMRALRNLIDGCLSGSPDARVLASFYGTDTAFVADKVEYAPNVVLKRLQAHYLELHTILMKILDDQMSEWSVSDPEYRILFKYRWQPSILNYLHMHEDERTVSLGSRTSFMCAIALVGDFIKHYFGDDHPKVKGELRDSLAMLLTIFDSDEYFILDDAEIKAILYICEISQLIARTGDASGVSIDTTGNVPMFQKTQKTAFGKKLAALPIDLKTIPYYKTAFAGTPLEHIDILLTRCLRQLHVFEKGKAYLYVYPDNIEEYVFFTTCHCSSSTDGDLSVIFANAFSPVYDFEDDDDDDESDDTYQNKRHSR